MNVDKYRKTNMYNDLCYLFGRVCFATTGGLKPDEAFSSGTLQGMFKLPFGRKCSRQRWRKVFNTSSYTLKLIYKWASKLSCIGPMR